MNYELGRLERLIQDELESYSIHEASAQKRKLPDFEQKLKMIREETAAIKARFASNVFGCSVPAEAKLYIQMHQTLLTALADRLEQAIGWEAAGDMTEAAENSTLQGLCKHLYQELEALLKFMKTYYAGYFDPDMKAPEVYRKKSVLELESRQAALFSGLSEAGADTRLLEICFLPVTELRQAPQEEISLSRVRYLKQLFEELGKLALAPAGATINERIISLLCYLNFNSIAFCEYCKELFEKELLEQETGFGRIERLQWLLKRNKQRPERPGTALRSRRTSVKDQLADWLEGELKYLQSTEHARKLWSAKPAEDDSDKLATSLSTAQLAYIAKLMTETALIDSGNQSAVIRFFAAHFAARNNEAISPVTFRVRYYNPERSTARAVREMLQQMVARSKKEIP